MLRSPTVSRRVAVEWPESAIDPAVPRCGQGRRAHATRSLMASVSDIRRTFLEYFRKQRPRGRGLEPARAAQRPDVDVHQRRHGAVQERLHRPREAALQRAPRRRRSACAPAASTTTSRMSATPRAITPSSRCWATSRSATTSRSSAIELAWNLITKEYGLPKDRLLVTVFTDDEEAAAYWRKITGFSNDKIIRIPTSDNFWAMGDTGPCGPCSEIFFDHGEDIPGGPPGSPDQDGDRFIEIWNLVFMQFEQVTKDERVSLPKPSIDTGMGLERIAAVLQGKHNNYDIDLFRALIEAVAHETGVDPDGPQSASHKVIADHLRATSFLIADGVLPSNEGRGYVLRRIMRRAMRHAHILGAQDPMVFKLVPTLVHEMGDAYPELVRAQPLIAETLKLEEDALQEDARHRPEAARRRDQGPERRRHAQGRRRLQALRHLRLPARPHAGRAARARHHGRHRGLREGDGRAARQGARGVGRLGRDRRPGDLVRRAPEGRRHRVPRLRHRARRGQDHGDHGRRQGSRLRSKAGQTGWLVVNQTPFYAESGGQQGDTGRFVGANGEAAIADVQKMRRRPACPSRQGREGRAQGRRRRRHDRRSRSAAPSCAPIIRRRICCTRRCAAISARTSRRRARWSRPTGCASTSATPRRSRPKSCARSRTRSTSASGSNSVGRHAPDDAGGGDRRRRHGAVRREVRRGGARAVDGRRGRREIFGRAVRRHACAAHRRHRPVPHRRRGRGLGRRAPHRGGRGQRGRGACAPPGRPAARGGGGHEGAAGGSAGPPAGAGRRPAQDRARAVARRARRWRWPAAAAAASTRPTRCARSAA